MPAAAVIKRMQALFRLMIGRKTDRMFIKLCVKGENLILTYRLEYSDSIGTKNFQRRNEIRRFWNEYQERKCITLLFTDIEERKLG